MPENVRQLLKTGSRMKDLNLARSSPVSEQLLPTGTPWIRRTPAWAQERQDQDRKQYLLNYDVVRVVGRITFPWIACPTISRQQLDLRFPPRDAMDAAEPDHGPSKVPKACTYATT
ncbi:hypothetical protein D917_00627 [Trichinella nativa]|uniref:Uncharacterized protein n=1 Tax=Trichinella nativa TaxID=6335 RepID=A0A1Y3E743_9BILA|nr:hypothetical protein D917_00627 [Trichinella nativa]